MAVQLTLAEVRAAGLKAYTEKLLSAQGPTPECSYRDKSGRPCIIGAALTDEDLAQMREASSAYNAMTVTMNRTDGLFVLDHPEEMQAAQNMHDAWCASLTDAEGGKFPGYIFGVRHELTAAQWEERLAQWLNTSSPA